MAKKLSEGLRKKQEIQKEQTIQKINNAINMLKEIGYEEITIKNLVEETNLARSTFSKPHVQEILKINKIGKYKDIKTIVLEKQEILNKNKLEELKKVLNNSQIKLKKVEKELSDIKAKLQKENLKRVELEIENREMIINFQKMYDRVISMGIEIIL